MSALRKGISLRIGKGLAMDSVYLVYDSSSQLLYVGVTCNLPQRMQAHRATSSWRGEVARLEARKYPTRDRAERVEARAISLLRPIHNIKDRRGKKEPER